MNLTKTEVAKQKKEFEKLFATGNYSQQQIAEMLGISRTSISKWATQSEPAKLQIIRKNLIKQLEQIAKEPYAKNKATVESLLNSIERIDLLISKRIK